MEQLFATKADLDQALTATKSDFKELLTDTKAEFEQLFATKADLASTEGRIEQLLADQADVILEAVDEKLDEKLDNKFSTVITKLDGVMTELQAHLFSFCLRCGGPILAFLKKRTLLPKSDANA